MKDSWDDSSDSESIEIETPEEIVNEPQFSTRPPIVCVVGHVDAGKTKLLDAIRMTNKRTKEAGGITQSIGATLIDNPPLLLIDTPGHESFYNLRECGTNACDIAIVAIDIMHGMKPQTIESLELLRETKTPFVVALNKIDLLYGWNRSKELESQDPNVQIEFKERLNTIVCQLAEQGFNAALISENKNVKKYVSIIPVSASQGYNIRYLAQVISKLCEKLLFKQLISKDDVECIVLDVNYTKGIGFAMDCILINGIVKKNDMIVTSGTKGLVKTKVHSLLKDNIYFNLIHKSSAVKIIADGIDTVIPGSRLYVYTDKTLEQFEKKLTATFELDVEKGGIHIQANSLGSVTAFAHFLKKNEIPIASWSIGNLNKKELRKCIISETNVVLAFNTQVSSDIDKFAQDNGITIFSDAVIYQLLEKYQKYQSELKDKLKQEYIDTAVLPCRLEIIDGCVFNARNPIVCGVRVLEGIVNVGTPICVSNKDCLELGKIVSMEKDHKSVKKGNVGDELAIKIEGSEYEVGRHFDVKDRLVSQISRESIDALKNVYSQKDLKKEIWMLVAQLKKELHIE